MLHAIRGGGPLQNKKPTTNSELFLGDLFCNHTGLVCIDDPPQKRPETKTFTESPVKTPAKEVASKSHFLEKSKTLH